MRRVNRLVLLLVQLGVGCVHVSKYTQQPEVVPNEDGLRELASRELDCPAGALQVTPVDGRLRFAVTGCERRGEYMLFSEWLGTARWLSMSPAD